MATLSRPQNGMWAGTLKDSIRIHEAVSKDERENIFRFRYDLYVQQMGRDKQSADHDRRMMTDWRDQKATILAAYCGRDLVGTGRINFSKDGPLGEEDLFQFERYEKRFPGKLSLTSKVMVAEAYRGSRVFNELAAAFFRLARDQKAALNFIITSTELMPLFSRFGFQRYDQAKAKTWLDYGVMNPLMLDLRDLEYLRKVRSPFAEIFSHPESHPKMRNQ